MKKGNRRGRLWMVICLGVLLALPSRAMAVEKAKKAALDYLRQRLSEACPMASFESEDPLVASASYTYDNAIAALAFLSARDMESASLILDGLVKGMQEDLSFRDRLRNAYMLGSPTDLPGYWDQEKEQWIQDAYHVGSSARSSSAAALAMLSYDRIMGEERYLDTAITAMDWVLEHCQDGGRGYTAGYVGWQDVGADTVLTYKSTADNFWIWGACQELAAATGWEKYEKAASEALDFAGEAMYSSGDSRFFTGTGEDGKTPSTALVHTETQALAALCLKDGSGLDNLERCHVQEGGYAYDNSNVHGASLEATALTALAFKKQGEKKKAKEVLLAIEECQLPSGAIPQASQDGLTTGEKDVVLHDWPSVGATAWFILAKNGTNPFEMDADS